MAPLLAQARLPQELATASQQLALRIAKSLRERKASAGRGWPGAGLAAGVFTVIPGRRGADVPGRGTAAHPRQSHRDALIRDKISNGQWDAHLGKSPSLFVNAATWGLLITGKLVATHSESSLGNLLLSRLIG